MKRHIFSSITVTCSLFFVSSCGRNDVPQPLERAVQAANQMTSAGMLEQSSFYVLYPNGTPSQFVSFIFSDIGASELPPVEGSGEISPDEEESMRSTYMPVWPAGVSMSPGRPNPELGMQVVWKWDDANRKIIIEGYVDPQNPPAIIQETDLPIVQPSMMARVAAH